MIEATPRTLLKGATNLPVENGSSLTTDPADEKVENSTKKAIKGFLKSESSSSDDHSGMKSNEKLNTVVNPPEKERVEEKKSPKVVGHAKTAKKPDSSRYITPFEKYLIGLNVMLSLGILLTVVGIVLRLNSVHFKMNLPSKESIQDLSSFLTNLPNHLFKWWQDVVR